jgi:hypothetical protein
VLGSGRPIRTCASLDQHRFAEVLKLSPISNAAGALSAPLASRIPAARGRSPEGITGLHLPSREFESTKAGVLADQVCEALLQALQTSYAPAFVIGKVKYFRTHSSYSLSNPRVFYFSLLTRTSK